MDSAQWTAYKEAVRWGSTAVQSSKNKAGSPSPTALTPVSSSALRSWLTFVSSVTSLVVCDVDLGVVLSFVAPPPSDSADGATATATETGGESQPVGVSTSNMNVLTRLHQRQRQRFGGEPFALRYHRAVRWTLLLACWIRARCWSQPAVEEVSLYQSLFVPPIRRMLSRATCEYLDALLFRATKQLKGRSTVSRHVSSSTVSEANATMHGRCVAAAVAAMKEAVGRDYLQITWDHINPKELPAAVQLRLNQLGNGAPSSSSSVPAETTLSEKASLHAVTFASLWPLLSRLSADSGGRGESTAALVCTRDDLVLLQHGLELVGYDMLTKLSCFCVERCYYAGPFLLDYAEWADHWSWAWTAAVRHDPLIGAAAQRRATALVPQLSAALLAAVQRVYSQHVRELLSDYKKRVSRVKERVPLTPSDAAKGVSGSLFRILVEVVEPTLDVLGREPIASPSTVPLPARIHMASQLFDLLTTTVTSELAACVKELTSPKALEQAAVDREVLQLYLRAP